MAAFLEKLRLVNFRNYTEREFEFSAPDVVISGKNGIGKTSLLEAIHYLSILRSFRTRRFAEIVRISTENLELEGQFDAGYRKTLKVCQGPVKKRELWIDHRKIVRGGEFIREFASVVFVPEDAEIIGGGGMFRRMFFDMLISKIDPVYMECLSCYQRALTQRNKALKNVRDPALIRAFDLVMAENIPFIRQKREEYSGLLEKELSESIRSCWGTKLTIKYKFAYPSDPEEYASLLRLNLEKDRLRGTTSIGPQLDDFIFELEGKELRFFGSTGQIRFVSLLLKIAEFRLLRAGIKRKLLLLVDDVTGELDQENRNMFLREMEPADQRFYTFAGPVRLNEKQNQFELLQIKE